MPTGIFFTISIFFFRKSIFLLLFISQLLLFGFLLFIHALTLVFSMGSVGIQKFWFIISINPGSIGSTDSHPPPKVNYSLIMNLFIPYNTSIFYKGIFFPFREKAGSDVSSIKQDTFRHLVRRSQCQVAGPAWVPPAAEAYLQPEEQHVLNWTSN